MERIISKREILMFKITLGVAIFVIIFNFVILPLFDKNKELNKELNLLQIRLKKYQWLLGQKEYLKNKYKEFIETFKMQDIDKDININILAELEEIAKNSNIHIIDIRSQSVLSGKIYKELVIELKTEGRVEDYIKFIYALENPLLLLKIKRFQVNAKSNREILDGSFVILRPLVIK